MTEQTNPQTGPGMNGASHPDNLLDGSLDSAVELQYAQMYPEDQEPKPKKAPAKDDDAEADKDEGETPGDDDDQDPDTDNAAQEGEEAEPTDADLDTIELEGKSFEVPAELKKAWDEGTLRQADYTQKTQELAERTRVTEASASHSQLLLDNASEYAQLLAEIKITESQLEQFKNLPWPEIKQNDAHRYMVLSADQNTLAWKKDQLDAKLKALPNEVAAKMEQARLEQWKAALPVIKRKIPEWSDKVEQRVMQAGVKMGFSAEEVRRGVTDPRVAHMLYLTGKQLGLEESKPQITKRVKEIAQKVVKPGASQGSGRSNPESEAQARFMKSKSPDDYAALIEQQLARRGYK